MIESAEEFKRLRESEIPQEYNRAVTESAALSTWRDVLETYPEMAFWLAQNKTVPVEVLRDLAVHQESSVRSMVARKRKIPESLMLLLAKDKDESVGHALVNNVKVTNKVLTILLEDPWHAVRARAAQRMAKTS